HPAGRRRAHAPCIRPVGANVSACRDFFDPSGDGSQRFSVMNFWMASAAASSSSPSTLMVTVSPCLTPMPMRAISLRISQLLPSFSMVAVLTWPLTTLTSRPAWRAWMPQASLMVYWNSFIDHFSLHSHKLGGSAAAPQPMCRQVIHTFRYLYYKPCRRILHSFILPIFRSNFCTFCTEHHVSPFSVPLIPQ